MKNFQEWKEAQDYAPFSIKGLPEKAKYWLDKYGINAQEAGGYFNLRAEDLLDIIDKARSGHGEEKYGYY
jgi:hypothetical protein